MSVASIEYTIDETVMEGHERDVAHVTAWLDRKASLRRPFTRYEPRHRADGPAI